MTFSAIDATLITRSTWNGVESDYVRLDIEPWVSPTVVKQLYQKLQQEIFGRKLSEPKALRNLAIFAFVNDQVRMNGGRRPPWLNICDDWNSQCDQIKQQWSDGVNDESDWHCGKGENPPDIEIRGDYLRAKKILVSGYCGIIDDYGWVETDAEDRYVKDSPLKIIT